MALLDGSGATEGDDIVLMTHGKPAVIMMSISRYDDLLEEMADLEDRLSVHERAGVTVSWESARAELDRD